MTLVQIYPGMNGLINAHLYTNVPSQPWPRTSFGLNIILPTFTKPSGTSENKRIKGNNQTEYNSFYNLSIYYIYKKFVHLSFKIVAMRKRVDPAISVPVEVSYGVKLICEYGVILTILHNQINFNCIGHH